MEMKNIVGLDLGTNSSGWAVIGADKDCEQLLCIKKAGSRIIPMDAAIIGDFEKGNKISQTAERTRMRGIRRLRERYLLRRERLHRVLRVMGFLPSHYDNLIDRNGKFADDSEPKIAWAKNASGENEFLFKESYNEMLAEFREAQPAMMQKGMKIPYDWTLYYLRKKALTREITNKELAWVLLNFNQKRGYNQQRGEEDEVEGKLVEFYELRVVKVEATDQKKGKDTWYNVHLENGWIYRRSSSTFLDWEGKVKQFIVTTNINEDGSYKLDKDGEVKRTFRAPNEDDWMLIKKKCERDLDNSEETVGAYIYDSILKKPSQKIIGGLVRTIERDYYKKELVAILRKQQELKRELQDKQLYAKCIDELYPSNEAYRESIANRDFVYLFAEDIVFYQRPLKSKKHLISDCQYESGYDKNGEKHGIKCVTKSHPLYQEFRLWQFIDNLRIYCNEMEVDGKLKTDVDVTSNYLHGEEDEVSLFEYLNDRTTINQKQLLEYLLGKGKTSQYRWNYVPDKVYPCNETRGEMLKQIGKIKNGTVRLLRVNGNEQESGQGEVSEMELWQILYSVEDKTELRKALTKLARRHGLGEEFVELFAKIKPYEKEYGAYSLKAIKKLLPLMRRGQMWNAKDIDAKTKDRIEKILAGEEDANITNRVREKSIKFTKEEDFKGLPLWLACYVVYDRFSERGESTRWTSVGDLRAFINDFKQYSLRNPIVEQVVLETMRTVADIWEECGHIDEIHVELGRELKNPADKRAKMAENMLKNETTNLRIKRMLSDFANLGLGISNVKPHSPSQQEILKIYEETVINEAEEIDSDIEGIIKKYNHVGEQPTPSEVQRYKMWLEQRYRSPYTGEVIPLAKLFTPAYEIEHVIPQSRYFDDSLSNKVICEAEVNKLKDNQLGYEFIKNHAGERVQIGDASERFVQVLTVEAYEKQVKETYSRMRTKMKKLLMEEIPDLFIERQLNDSRYISRYIISLLSNIVREEDEAESTAKRLIVCNGAVTDKLKKDWGVNDVWNSIVLPRFERMNEMTGRTDFTAKNNRGKLIPNMPLEYQQGFNKKRIDHRHHAMDAIVIACATRNHVNLLSNESAKSENKKNRYQLSRKLRRYEKKIYEKPIDGKMEKVEREVAQEFYKPWDTFTQDVKEALEKIIVSFKSVNRIINKGSNKYERIVEGKKTLVLQEKGDMMVVRKPMHKDTIYGLVNLRRVKVVNLSIALTEIYQIVDAEVRSKVKELRAQGMDDKKIVKYLVENKESYEGFDEKKVPCYYYTNDTKEPIVAVRKRLVDIFSDASSEKKVMERIDSITDTGIQKILTAHFEKEDKKTTAFTAEGIERMNANIYELNGKVKHQPIYSARITEIQGAKYAIGQHGQKAKKYVEAAKGTNLYYGVYADEEGNRTFKTVGLNEAIMLLEQGQEPVPTVDENGNKLLFYLSPNDMVYVPTPEEIETKHVNEPLDINRIYKAVSFTGRKSYYIGQRVASPILNKVEFYSMNIIGRALTGEMIKDVCIPVKIDRLGNIVKIGEIM